MDKIEHEVCPLCKNKTLTLIEDEMDIPYFGKTFLFSMNCSSCHYEMSDVEAAEQKNPCKITFTLEKEEDLKVRVVKSSQATVKVPQLKMSVTPGPSSVGYISNIEGVIDRFVKVIEGERDTTEEDDVRKHAKNLLKKIRKAKWGELPLKIIIEDPSGNSAIISEKAEITPLKK
ncbi:ZPR1 zinc finger domain-containing protein [Candidatus Woesearchaeota archaeon]|nr:ZPR1 zinc finger domain-containing protein [Candidatus Woesearchaeota archaeon]